MRTPFRTAGEGPMNLKFRLPSTLKAGCVTKPINLTVSVSFVSADPRFQTNAALSFFTY
jgi:hypothetical protein